MSAIESMAVAFANIDVTSRHYVPSPSKDQEELVWVSDEFYQVTYCSDFPLFDL
jgi:hypothetical protein